MACNKYFMRGANTTRPAAWFFICDATDDLPTLTTGDKGSLSYQVDTGVFRTWDGAAWQEPSASAAWGAITGTLSGQTDLQTALDAKQAASAKGQANGYASLDSGGKVPSAQLPSSGGGPASCRSTGAQSKTDATLVNCGGLAFSVVSGTYYHFKFLVPFRSSVATVGLKLGLTFPAVTRFAGSCRIPIAAAGAGGELQGPITATGGSVVGTAVPAINTDYCAICEGVILPSASGTLQLQFAAETTGATVTLQPESVGFLYTVA